MNRVFATVFAIFYLANYFVLSGTHVFLLSDIITLSWLLLLPGILLLIILGIKPSSFWEGLAYSVGLSLTCIMFGGLEINTILPKLGIVHPLTTMPVLISFDTFLIILLIAAIKRSHSFRFSFRRKIRRYMALAKAVIDRLISTGEDDEESMQRNNSFTLKTIVTKTRSRISLGLNNFAISIKSGLKNVKQTFRKPSIFFILSGFLFPLLAILGATSLNNGGSNFFTLFMLGGIAVYVVALLIFQKKLASFVLPTAIYIIGLALLLMTSLRGWFITGHDVQIEYYVFQLTKHNYFWNIDLYKDAYNACLSITILPTILSDFFRGSDAYIYKLIFQFIFALCPVIVYMFIKKYTSPIIAFLTTFYFLAFPTFLTDMPMLNRQEIGFLFLALMLYLLFKPNKRFGENLLVYIFGLSMIVSHYSTTYVTVGLLTLVYGINIIFGTDLFKKLFRKYLSRNILWKKANRFSPTQYISLKLVIVLIIATFSWNSLLTKTSSGFSQTVVQTVTGINTIFQQDNKSADITYSLFAHHDLNNTQYLNNYIGTTVEELKEQGANDFYPPSTYVNYKPEIVNNTVLPLTGIGNILKPFNLFQANYILRQFCAKIIQILIGIGLISLFFYKRSKRNPYDREYVIACFVSMFLIVLMTVLPALSLNYGLLRLFQQLLMLLGLPLVIGNLSLLRFLGKGRAFVLTGVLSIVFFLSLSGFISETTGGYYPQLNLDNAGLYYDAYYLHKSEVSSINWLDQSTKSDATIQADADVYNKLLALSNRYSFTDSIPQAIQKSGYVYANYTNSMGRTIISMDRMLTIKFPLPFLDNNKDLIYNNGSSRIYR